MKFGIAILVMVGVGIGLGYGWQKVFVENEEFEIADVNFNDGRGERSLFVARSIRFEDWD